MIDNEEMELEFEQTESDESEIDLSQHKNINYDSKDPEIRGLHDQYKRGRLVIQPNYQRKYVWDAKKASKLIESILINIPIPIIYLAATKDNKINVIDGQQRLTSVFSFIDGSFPDGKAFKLSGLNVYSELNGKAYRDLEESLQNKISDYSIRTITFSADSNPDLQYEIFSRLNTGSVALNDQELRNCIYRGKFNELIKELASDEAYLKLLGMKTPHKRMKDVELVLRFIAFYEKSYINYSSPVKKFLNDTMREKNNIADADAKRIKEAFKKAVTNLTYLLGENSFRRFKMDGVNGSWEKNRLNVALFGILMDSMARLETTVLMRHLDAIREAYIDLMVSNQDFINSIMINTSDTPVVNRRFEIWRNTLNSIIQDDQAETRCFTKELKQTLYDENPTCAICSQHINSIDDCAVDHIEQYWMGGKTIPENARLTHRFCNCSRSRTEQITRA